MTSTDTKGRVIDWMKVMEKEPREPLPQPRTGSTRNMPDNSDKSLPMLPKNKADRGSFSERISSWKRYLRPHNHRPQT